MIYAVSGNYGAHSLSRQEQTGNNMSTLEQLLPGGRTKGPRVNVIGTDHGYVEMTHVSSAASNRHVTINDYASKNDFVRFFRLGQGKDESTAEFFAHRRR
jgi:hypothetical protein